MAQKERGILAEHGLDFVELWDQAQKMGLSVQSKGDTFDLEAGWNAQKSEHRKRFRKFQKEMKPLMLTMSPECKFFTQLLRINRGKMSAEVLRRGLAEGRVM